MTFPSAPLLSEYRLAQVNNKTGFGKYQNQQKLIKEKRENISELLKAYYSESIQAGEPLVAEIFKLAEEVLRFDDERLQIPLNRKGRYAQSTFVSYINSIFVYGPERKPAIGFATDFIAFLNAKIQGRQPMLPKQSSEGEAQQQMGEQKSLKEKMCSGFAKLKK